jgi:hypothetical protein
LCGLRASRHSANFRDPAAGDPPTDSGDHLPEGLHSTSGLSPWAAVCGVPDH